MEIIVIICRTDSRSDRNSQRAGISLRLFARLFIFKMSDAALKHSELKIFDRMNESIKKIVLRQTKIRAFIPK